MQKIDFVNAQEPAINDTNLNLMQTYIETAINAQVSGDTLPIGCIVPFTSDTVPENWLLCDGSAISRTDYALLFSIIGTTYGVGDGSTTFNLPDLRGRVPLGKGTGTGAGGETYNFELANKGGEYSHILTVGEMPSHTHIIADTENGAIRVQGYGNSSQHTGRIRTDADVEWTNHTLTAAPTGGGAAHNLLQPFEVHNFIIKVKQSAGIVATVVDGLNSTSTTDALSANQGKVLNEKMFPMEILANNYNIDNIKKSGFYGIFNATGTLPTGYSTSDNNIFIENIMWSSDFGRQILHDVRTKNTYIRNLSANSWNSWSQIV